MERPELDVGVATEVERGPELPRGGHELFPRYRLVGYCGTPGGPSLGRLQGNLGKWAREIEQKAQAYARDRTALPVFELVAVVTTHDPGPDGLNRRRVPDWVVDDYLKAARADKALLLLNIQPGASDFLTEAEHFDKWLHEPDVGLALDPEWAMKAKQVPGAQFGQVTGKKLNEVGEYLSSIVEDGDLPEKVLVFHQVNQWVLKGEEDIVQHPGVVMIKSVDGLGPSGTKVKTFNAMVKTMTPGVHAGFKLFFDEDTKGGHRLMTPGEVLALSPEVEYVMYE